MKIFRPGEEGPAIPPAPPPKRPSIPDDAPDPIDLAAKDLGIAPTDYTCDEWGNLLAVFKPKLYVEPDREDSPQLCMSRAARIRMYAIRRKRKLKLFNPNDQIRKDAEHVERKAKRLRNGAVVEGGAQSRDGERSPPQQQKGQ